VYFAITMAQKGTDVQDWFARWFAVDVLYRLSVGMLGGLAVGWLLGRLFFSSRRDELRLADHREGFVALAATFLPTASPSSSRATASSRCSSPP
jgi:NhaP-type Na+/H+ or K+/H+ antiporter